MGQTGDGGLTATAAAPGPDVTHTLGPVERDVVNLHRLGLIDTPVRVTVPPATAARAVAAGVLILLDEERAPVARLARPTLVGSAASGPAGTAAPAEPLAGAATAAMAATLEGRLQVIDAGPLILGNAPYGPARLRAEPGGTRDIVVITDRPLLRSDATRFADGPGLLLVVVGHGATRLLPPRALWHAVSAWAGEYAPGWRLLPVPVPPGADPAASGALRRQIARAYGARTVIDLASPDATVDMLLSQLRQRLDAGLPIRRLAGRDAARVLRRSRPPAGRRGVVLFFTGFSGSGKSTVARGVRDVLDLDGSRTVTMLDGDVVRRMLSAGLGFSRSDRELNLHRIGWVAAEVARHGGIAICAPIAPYAASRDQARRLAVEAGADFLLVWVSTPLDVCERRDRKGLYARARAGEVAEFTGISSPYEEPGDADLVIDTTTLAVDDAIGQVVHLLRDRGAIRRTDGTSAPDVG